MPYPAIDPIMLQVGPFAIRWYAMAYIIGLFGGWYYFSKLDKKEPLLNKDAFENILVYTLLGIIIGGRIGYILFYNLPFYLHSPLEILKVWRGGMSFHGGAIGVIFSLYLFSRRYKVPYLKLMDKVVCVVPIGLCLGRLANFVNAELYGRITNAPWAMIFPGSDLQPRHPSQLYESFLEGIVLLFLLGLLFYKTRAREYPGTISGVFLLGYAACRIAVEPFRQPDPQLGTIIGSITMGQILSLPMIVVGLYLIIKGIYDRKKLSV
ncbi:MAG: prolipoprotein diacylglyceryl transferase [Alphaproteobacteria bacterium]|nr:prolipoprotein diacylglyceryl transferase [Alphaproteobacteria bacterium]